jgi:iron complex transport system ATP-binding protein
MNLKVNEIVFGYSSVPILDKVMLELDCSEVIGIVGPNGAGKSTLIRCINKILKPQEGTVTLDGRDINDMSRMEISRRLGYVPQNSSNTFPATVFDTILMGRRPHSGWRSSRDDVKKVLDTLRLVGIEKLAMRDFNELSGGQQQKVILARALVQEADILLLDEPTSNLDVKQQLETMEIVRSMVAEKGISAILAIHDLNLAAKYADRIVMLKDGRIYDVGEPFSVFTGENIRDVYGVEAEVKEDEGKPYILVKRPLKNLDENG